MRAAFLPPFIAAALSFLSVPPLNAQNAEPDGVSLESLRDILAQNDFGGEKEQWRLRIKQDIEYSPLKQEDTAPWVDFFSRIAAHALRVIALAAAAVFIIIILLKARRLEIFKPRTQTKQQITAAEYPESAAALLRRAQDAFRQGRLREAWTHCYTCALAAYAEAGQPFPAGATEYECLRTGGHNGGAGFETIVENRVNIAYRGMEPEQAGFAQSILFCEELISRKGGG